jgi:hypothetical protein
MLRTLVRIVGVGLFIAGGYVLFCGACMLAGANWACPCAEAFSLCASGQIVIVIGGAISLLGMGLALWRPDETKQGS